MDKPYYDFRKDSSYYDFITMFDDDLMAADQMFEDLKAGTFYEKQHFQGHPPKFLTTCKCCGMPTALPENEESCYPCRNK
jgi:Zn finger protein HypA/HybF involved in hydrogenase expression